MLKVNAWPDVSWLTSTATKTTTSTKWLRLFLSKKSLHQPGLTSEIKRAYPYEPVIFRNGQIHVPLTFPNGASFVLVEKPNFVAVWGYARQENRYSRTGYGIVTWFRYYFEPEPKFTPSATAALPTPTPGAPAPTPAPLGKLEKLEKLGLGLNIQRLTWSQLGSRIQHEVTECWQSVAPAWMQSPEKLSRYRPGLIVSGKTGKTASITAADIIAADTTTIEIDEVVMLTSRISDQDILL